MQTFRVIQLLKQKLKTMTLIESNQNNNFSGILLQKMKGTLFRSHLIQRLHFRDEEIEAQIG